MQELKMDWTGTTPMLMHNEQLANPMNEYTIALSALTSKRKKTLSDHWEISRLEWEAGLYVHEGVIQLPARMIHSCIVEGAKMNKNGKKLKEGAMPSATHYPLEYGSPVLRLDGNAMPNPSLDKHWKEYFYQATVGISKSRVMRTRPKFNRWGIEVGIIFDENHISREELIQAAENAGRYKGLGDYRPMFGRFAAKVLP